MRKWLLPLSIALLVFLLYREFTKETPVEEQPAPPPPKHTATPSRPQPPPQTTDLRPPPSKPAQRQLGQTMKVQKPADGSRPKPPKNSVPFKRYGDLVVSFGDVLLGKPNDPNFPDEGFIEASKPENWRNQTEIAYSFHPDLPDRERVLRAIQYFNENTPVRFVPYTNQQDSIVFVPHNIELCLSYVGRVGGHQPIYLHDRCTDKEIMHELMHALGFIHEQSRPDRDRYVKVNWDKIQEDRQSQFEIAPAMMAGPQSGRPFDFHSIMIYDSNAFAKNPGDLTLESRTGEKIEPAPQGLSEEDHARLEILYTR